MQPKNHPQKTHFPKKSLKIKISIFIGRFFPTKVTSYPYKKQRFLHRPGPISSLQPSRRPTVSEKNPGKFFPQNVSKCRKKPTFQKSNGKFIYGFYVNLIKFTGESHVNLINWRLFPLKSKRVFFVNLFSPRLQRKRNPEGLKKLRCCPNGL